MSCCLGFDTSNYRTSCALVRIGEKGAAPEILASEGRLLTVKEGGRGLRQSEAFFQHVQALPEILEKALAAAPTAAREEIACVAVSTRPRPVDGSYMPVFTAGQSEARAIALALGVPVYTFSHQEGHIAAAAHGTPLAEMERFCAFHFSGGTTESLLVEKQPAGGFQFRKIGGTLDISFGQLLDRTGVRLGYGFPCGEALDRLALDESSPGRLLPKVRVKDGAFNLSGIENQAEKLIGQEAPARLASALFDLIAETITECIRQAREELGIRHFLLAGGVSSSVTLRRRMAFPDDTFVYYGEPALCGDNAAGIALLGGQAYAAETGHGHTAE